MAAPLLRILCARVGTTQPPAPILNQLKAPRQRDLTGSGCVARFVLWRRFKEYDRRTPVHYHQPPPTASARSPCSKSKAPSCHPERSTTASPASRRLVEGPLTPCRTLGFARNFQSDTIFPPLASALRICHPEEVEACAPSAGLPTKRPALSEAEGTPVLVATASTAGRPTFGVFAKGWDAANANPSGLRGCKFSTVSATVTSDPCVHSQKFLHHCPSGGVPTTRCTPRRASPLLSRF